MRKRIALLLAVAAVGVGATSPIASAQDEGATTEEDGSDYGWIGLLGLAGLAGLAGLRRRDRDDTTTRR